MWKLSLFYFGELNAKKYGKCLGERLNGEFRCYSGLDMFCDSGLDMFCDSGLEMFCDSGLETFCYSGLDMVLFCKFYSLWKGRISSSLKIV